MGHPNSDITGAVFELADDGIVVHALTHPTVTEPFVAVNPAFCRLLRYTRDEVLQMALADVIAPRDREAALQEYVTLRREGSMRHERALLRSDGRCIPCEVVSRVFERDGRSMVISLVRDITERRQAQQALNESEAGQSRQRRFLETLLDSADVCIAVMQGRELRYTLANAAYRALRPDMEILGRTYGEVFPGAFDTGTADVVRQVMETGEPHEHRGYDIPMPGKPDASWDHRIVRLPVEDGEEPSVLVITWDVTDHKRARRALERSEERFRAAADHFPGVYVIYDSERRMRFLSSTGVEKVGRPAEELLGKRDEEVWPKEVTDKYLPQLKKVWETGESQRFEAEMQIPGGDDFTGLITYVPLHDENGTIREVLGILFDITDRKRAEEELRRSRKDLAGAQAVGQVGSWRLDTRNGKLLWSDETYRIFGVPHGTPRSYEDFLEIVYHEDRGMLDRQWQAALQGEPYEIEHRILVDGEIRWVREKAYLEFDADGDVLGGLGITQDITDRKKAEEALQHANETLEQRVAERTAKVRRQAGRLRALAARLSEAEQRERRRLAGVLHDHVQQHIVAAQMQVEALRDRSASENVQSAANSIHDILDQAFHVTRDLSVDLSPPALHQGGLGDALDWLAARMEEQNDFRVACHAEGDAEPQSEQVRLLLFECARELLFNAVKHAGVSEAEVSLSRADAGHVQLVVTDEGAGFQADLLEERGPEDVTFGLFSIQERLAYINGAMQIESVPGDGTRITLTVPTRGRARLSAEKPVGGGIRVLIADDHRAVRRMLVARLGEEEGIRVVGEAGDGEQAVRLAREERPDVLVMDLRMPGLDGAAATRQIQQECPRVRIIGHSACDPTEEHGEAMAALGITCVQKESSCEQLIAAIREAADSGQASPQPVRDGFVVSRSSTRRDARRKSQ